MCKLFIIFIFIISANSLSIANLNDKQGESRLAFADQHTRYSIGENVMEKLTLEEIQSKKYGRLTVVSEVAPRFTPSGEKQRRVFCECDCGNESSVYLKHLRNKHTQSCGCYKTETTIGNKHSATHGLSQHLLYAVWCSMRARCYSPNNPAYRNYGGRGITVCEEWSKDFKIFYDWAKQSGYRKGLEIDRRDNNGNYEPSNCRFVTSAVNNRNQSTTKLNWDMVKEIRETKLLLGNSVSQKELGDVYKVSSSTIGFILNNKIWVE